MLWVSSVYGFGGWGKAHAPLSFGGPVLILCPPPSIAVVEVPAGDKVDEDAEMKGHYTVRVGSVVFCEL